MCPCGGHSVERTAKSGDHLLNYDQCKACVRQGGYRLYVGGALISRGREAQTTFLAVLSSKPADVPPWEDAGG